MVELTNKEFFQDLDQTIAAQLFYFGNWTNIVQR